MKTPKLLNNDIVILNGKIVWHYDKDALSQILANRLKLWLGEWFLAPSSGVDWFGLVDQKGFLKARFISELRTNILNEPNVSRVARLDASFDNKTRIVNCNMEIESIFGPIAISIPVVV